MPRIKQLLDENMNPLSPLKSYLRQCRTAKQNGNFRMTSEGRLLSMPNVVGFDTRRISPGVGGETGPKRKIDGFFPPVKRLPKAQTNSKSFDDSIPSIPHTGKPEGNLELSPNADLTAKYYEVPVESPDWPPIRRPFPTFVCRKYTGEEEPPTYSNLLQKMTRSPSKLTEGGDVSFLPRPNAFHVHTAAVFVKRHKIKHGQTLLSKIMTGNDRSTTALPSNRALRKSATTLGAHPIQTDLFTEHSLPVQSTFPVG